MTAFEFHAADESGTDALGAALAAHLPRQLTIALDGTLGAGKTRLVQAVAVACCIDRRDVLSPTFVLGQHYRGARTIHHFDLYRLKDEDELESLGLDEYFDSPSLTFVEWADKFPGCLPEEHLEIAIRVTGETSRTFTFHPHGHAAEEAMRTIAANLR